ncbi:hypothetical protein TPHA_0B04180 [Tetrapisispora phaffii CBS 4417]|uniref:Uncharacterized protein n=1 Tax=Tetrapisispora phaffii (strain ATCC 24235 / CBS 4417 / NBRC 1672 / NRRL Y-8282 / UCD 70-5) TaxID=1071381 RepID=G8BQ07_TETPH|nr:hypothetical protein TPHA_0B04180 [Tetrapisispora phaffii CBS 4417]CCE62088.1 hypothetical protein TPHA_0B04180 [Tetrapisispora phaffii CBS 4417]
MVELAPPENKINSNLDNGIEINIAKKARHVGSDLGKDRRHPNKSEKKHEKISNSEASRIIGGADVRSSASRKQNNDIEFNALSDADSDSEVQSEESVDDVAESLESYSGESICSNANSDVNSEELELHPFESHKIFSFQLPFGGKSNTSTMSKLKSILTTPLPEFGESSELQVRKARVKEKLRRQESISTIEEQILFRDAKGMGNVRSMAIKESLHMGSLKNTIRTISNDFHRITGDTSVPELDRIETIFDELEGDLVIMGGYRGSILRDKKTGRRVWIPIKTALNLREEDLLIGPTKNDEMQEEDKIKPDDMLKNVGPIDVSRKLIKRLRSSGKLHVEEFGYDWRLSLDIPAKHLLDKLQSLYDTQVEKKGVYIVAHSMGGMVTHKVLQTHTHLIRGVIYVGCPSQCPNILGPIRFGDEVMINKKILSPEANFFMRSSFSFLPIDGRCFVDKKQKKRYDLDFFDPDVWVELGLSPLVNKKRKEYFGELKSTESVTSLTGFNTYLSGSQKLIQTLNPMKLLKSVTSSEDLVEDIQEESFEFKTSYEDSYSYLKRTLAETKDFLNSLNYIPEKKYPPLAIVYGNKVPTVRGAKVNGLDDIKEGRYFDFYYGPGDGVVHHKWLLPERRGFPVDAKIPSRAGHVSLMTDMKAMGKAFIALVDNEKVAKKHK